MTTPTVSIVMTAYNAEDTIERAVRSVFAQDRADWELIVVDDGSTDETLQILQDLESELADPRLRILTGANVGLPRARNKGMDVATGEWFSFLDSDDEYTPDRLSKMLAAVTDDEIDLVVCRHTMIASDGTTRVRGADGTDPIGGWDAAVFALEDRIPPYAWDKLFRASTVGDLRYQPVHRAEDKVFVLAHLIKSRVVVCIPDSLVRYYITGTSLTWGRVATVAETEELLAALTEAAGLLGDSARGRDALAVASTSAYLSAAHQGIAKLPEAEVVPFAKACAKRISAADLRATTKARPTFGAAASLLKAAPAAYARLYRAYVNKRYAITA
ncbi:glycosyltransferase family 2 protein [Granulicoccus phenolivorans]|uniref:glycosyltransferase family 2 protein n=1 Tax=Granulicoccus phenolivorans TaxID=266854 RepID=UPI00041EB6D4|nr:glycosyltransferase family 2 protein [Granulicoccus phenolivorans]